MELKRFVRYWGIIFVSLLLVACQQEVEPQPLPTDGQWMQGQFDNGLKYHFRPVSGETVALRLLVHTGAVDETPEQAGYAHFLEHMAFLGSAGFGAKSVESLFAEAGVSFGNDLNAFTTHDETYYQVNLPDNKQLESAITWLSDIATGKLSLEPALMENEKGAVFGEFRYAQLGDKPAELKIFEALLHGSRYEGREVLGTQENIKNLNREGLLAFYRTHYVPDNMELIISGDIESKQLESLLAKHFGSSLKMMVQPEVSRDKENEGIASLTSEPLFVSGAAGQSSGFALLTELSDSPVTTNVDYLKLMFESAVLQAISQRLNDRIITTQAPVVSVYTSRNLVIDRNLGVIAAEFTEADRLAAQSFIAQELASLRDHGVGEVELAAIKEMWRGELRNLDTQWLNKKAADYADDRLYTIMAGETLVGKETERSMVQQFVEQLDRTTLNKAIHAYLTVANTKPILQLTKEENTDNAKASYPVFKKQLSASGKALLIAASTAGEFPLPEKGGEITAYEAIEPTVHRWMLDNGIEVWLKQMPEAGDNAYLYLMSSGGLAALPPEQRHIADMVGPVMRRSGLADLTAPELDKLLRRRSTYLEPVIWSTSHGLYSETSRNELPFALSVLYQAMTQSKVDEKQFNAVRKDIAADQEQWLASPNGMFVHQYVGTLYPSQSPHQIVNGEDFLQVQAGQVQEVAETLMKKDRNFILVASADIEADEFAGVMKRYLGGIELESAAPVTDYKTNPKVSVTSLEVPEAIDGTVSYLFSLISQGEPKTTRDRFTSDIFYRILNQRYRDELRNAQGLSYAPYVSMSWFDGSGEASVGFSINAAPDKLDAVRRGTRQVLDKARKGFTEAEFATAKSQLASDLKSGQSNAQEQARMLSSYLLFGADPQAVLHPEKMMSTLRLDEVNALANRLIGKEAQQMEAMLTPKKHQEKG